MLAATSFSYQVIVVDVCIMIIVVTLVKLVLLMNIASVEYPYKYAALLPKAFSITPRCPK